MGELASREEWEELSECHAHFSPGMLIGLINQLNLGKEEFVPRFMSRFEYRMTDDILELREKQASTGRRGYTFIGWSNAGDTFGACKDKARELIVDYETFGRRILKQEDLPSINMIALSWQDPPSPENPAKLAKIGLRPV